MAFIERSLRKLTEGLFRYHSDDDVLATGYFANAAHNLKTGDTILLHRGDGSFKDVIGVQLVSQKTSSVAASVLSAPAGAAAKKSRLISQRFRALGEAADGGAGGTNYVRSEARYRASVGSASVTDIRLVFANWKILSTGAGEQVGANAITVDAALEPSTQSYHVPVTFNGQDSVVIAPGATVVSDPVPFDVDANSFVFVRCGVQVTSGQTWPKGTYAQGAGDVVIEKISTTNNIRAFGTIGTDGGVTSPTGYGPIAAIGTHGADIPAILWLGDSISVGQGDSTFNGYGAGSGNNGFLARGIAAASSSLIPYCAMARSGDALLTTKAAYGPRKRNVFGYASHAIIQHGTNDFNSQNFAGQQGNVQEAVKALRNRGVRHITAVTVVPKTTSSDNWATAANQTYYNANFTPGGARDQYNAWLKAGADGLIDACVDFASVAEDPANPGKWITTGAAQYATADGVHPSAVIHAAGAVLVKNVVQTFG